MVLRHQLNILASQVSSTSAQMGRRAHSVRYSLISLMSCNFQVYMHPSTFSSCWDVGLLVSMGSMYCHQHEQGHVKGTSFGMANRSTTACIHALLETEDHEATAWVGLPLQHVHLLICIACLYMGQGGLKEGSMVCLGVPTLVCLVMDEGQLLQEITDAGYFSFQ